MHLENFVEDDNIYRQIAVKRLHKPKLKYVVFQNVPRSSLLAEKKLSNLEKPGQEMKYDCSRSEISYILREYHYLNL